MDRLTRRALLRWVPAVVLVAFPGLAAASEQVLLLDGPGLSWREARRIIEEHGGELVHVLPPSVLVGEIPEGAFAALQEAAGTAPGSLGLRIVRTRAEAQSLLATALTSSRSPAGALSTEAQAALRLLAPEVVPADRDPRYRVLPDGRVEVRPIEEWEEPPVVGPKRTLSGDAQLQAVGNTFVNTSDFLAGDVAVAILRPESTGAIDPSTEDWTAGEVANSLTQILGALDKLRNDSPRGKLTFVYRTESFGPGVAGTVSCDYEAILYANWTEAVVLDVLGKLGYSQPSGYSRLYYWVNDARADLGTDWAFGIIVVDNSSDTSRGRASAYLTGPAGWLFQSYTSTVYHHEMGHIWGATDEYHPDAAQSPTLLVGYTQEVNANSQYNDGTGYFGGAGESISALMIDNVDYASPWTRGQWGTWDLDGDGVNDTQDTFPTVVLNAPSGSSTLAFTGTANVTPLKMESGAWADADISVNRIVRVEWRVNGGPWQPATPSDGAFDESSEAFTFTTPDLRNGGYIFEARAADNFGNATTLYPRREVAVAGSAAANNRPMPALAVTPALGSTATAFQLDATGSLDAEDGSALQYRWDYENDGSWDTSFSASPTASQTYGTAGAKTARVEVRDGGGATSTRTASFTVSATPVAPTATFTVDLGAGFMTSPAVFNFDASGVSDGEDAPAALQVRWDFDDDGVWDTGYSTTKTASHGYARGYAVGPSVESGNTYLYAGNAVDGFAEGFVAASTGVGKAELYLRHYNDHTPGGTVTVGIRSTLTGPFLTSLTRNQADLKEGDWNLFDLPDVAVRSGGRYYLVLISSDTDVMWLADTSNPYAGGGHWYSTNGGASWTSNTAYDHVFRIYASELSTVPLTKSRAWRARMEVKDTSGQTAQTVRDFWTNAYDTPPTVSLSASPTSGTTSTTFDLTAAGADANYGTIWDGLLNYRWDVDGDGNFETEFGGANTKSVTFAQTGTYQATVEVRDRYHATARASVTLTVSSGSQPAVSIDDVTVTEGDSGTVTASFTVSLSAASGQTVVVNYSTADGTATAADADYVPAAGTLSFAPGQTTRFVNVIVNGDTSYEANETFTVTLSGPVNASIADGEGVGTIGNDDPVPTLSIGDVAVTEGNSGTVTAGFTVSLSAASSQAVTVGYATADATATTADADYVAASGTLTIAPGVTTQPANVTVNGDTKYEANETFTVTLSGPVNATIADGQGVGTITNDDPVPALSIDDVTVTEGNSGTVTASFTVSLSAASSQAVAVGYGTADGTATTADADYVPAAGTLSFAPGQTTRSVNVIVNGDSKYEANEAFTVSLSGPVNASIADGEGVGTISNDDPAPALSIDDVTVAEGNSGTTTAGFTVSLSAVSGQTVTVNYATADGTAATADADYVAASGTLTFAPGVTTQPANVTVNGDTKNEANETFAVNLGAPVNAMILDSQGVGTITNDDPVPALSIDEVTVAEGSSGTTTASFTVSLSAASGQTVTVGYATADGTATTADADYAATSGTLTFAPGQTTRPLNVIVNGDTKYEANETFTVNLSGPANATIADGQGVGTITNDDPVTRLLTVTTAGSGSGKVTSAPPGIDCGADCTEDYAEGTVVTLTAAPDPGSTFESWSGGCGGTSLTCELTMDTDRAATATFAPPPGTDFYTVTPCRVLDSREPGGPWGGEPLHAGQERTVTIVGPACAIPPTATALSFNITATGATTVGHLRVYPAGTTTPRTSTLNFAAGQNRANNGVVRLGAGGGLAVYSGQASGTVHVVLDVNGYFE
jgi:Calx-beta domain/Divergent InlB B-repeat domain